MSEFVWDWIEDESLPHRGEYVVRRREAEILAHCGPHKRGYDDAVRIATALNARVESGEEAE